MPNYFPDGGQPGASAPAMNSPANRPLGATNPMLRRGGFGQGGQGGGFGGWGAFGRAGRSLGQQGSAIPQTGGQMAPQGAPPGYNFNAIPRMDAGTETGPVGGINPGPRQPFGQSIQSLVGGIGAPRPGLDTSAPPPALPMRSADPMGGNFSQNEGIGATMTPQQIGAFGDPETQQFQPATQPWKNLGQTPGQLAPMAPGPYGVTSPVDPGRQLPQGPPQIDPWAFMYDQPAQQPQQPPQVQPPVAPGPQGGPQYDASGNLVSGITRWQPPGQANALLMQGNG